MPNSNNVLVTGGAGFIGSHVTELLLSEGFNVRVVDNFSTGRPQNLETIQNDSKLEVIEEDIRKIDPKSKVFKDVRFVYHLAGKGDIVPSIESPLDYMDTNLQGTLRVLEASRFNQVSKFIYAASSSCYGIANVPTNETHPIDPQYPYALSKYLGELAALHWFKVYKLPVNSICIFNAYGPRVKTNGAYGAVFGVFLKQKLEGKPLTVVGDGEQARDFVHVKDVSRAFYLASTSAIAGERFNIGAGKPITINNLVKIIGGEKVYLPRRPGEPLITFADISKAQRLLAWSPNIDFAEGVREMLGNIDYWSDAPLWEIESITASTRAWFQYLGKDY